MINKGEIVSIVVAIFNVGKYLDRCVLSIVNQTYKNIEIILVDDGSTDNSSMLCDKWLQKDKRIKVIHKNNGGLSDARNAGLNKATGDYICFVDGDDYIEKNMVEVSLKYVTSSEAGVVIFSNYDVSADGHKTQRNIYSSEELYTESNIIPKLLDECIGTMPTSKSDYDIGFSPWGRLCKRSVLINNNVYFKDEHILIYEDLMFLLDLLPVITKAVVINQPLYDYCENSNSLTRRFDVSRFNKIKKQYYYLKNNKQYSKLIFGNFETKLRFERTVIGYIRNAVTILAQNHAVQSIKEICNDEFTQELLQNYPINKLPIKQSIFAFAFKYKMVRLLMMLIRLKSTMKK
ncbi:glycosyltransferase family 2 protein [Limosilactobacillus oris]|uniref:glycosyltransferase family 2 protein n=1 Tax=Limosilactobacillus oris TaxID=1632 RepID=UPI001883953E|nr:glycosyltransferase family 2 protein [Limosilactobacillus oris]MBF0601919.1 glycosyltransferase family 2 protein [Limosilactobacillus oris]